MEFVRYANRAQNKMASSSHSSGKRLWQRATFVASNTAAFLNSFHTLRDMVPEVFIDPSELVHIKRLGEGDVSL